FSDRSEFGFRLACSLARDYSARLVVLHVASAPTVVYGEGIVPPEPEDFLAEAKERLDQIEAPSEGVQLDRRLGAGDQAAEILRVAKEIGAGLTVMGTPGRTGLGRLL